MDFNQRPTCALDSFCSWLRQKISQTLKGSEDSFIVWCDPERVWKELLEQAVDSFEVWADDVHELLIRERFYTTPRVRRVIWLPVARDDISYFKVFELQAADVIDMSLAEGLSEYGVDIPSEQLIDLKHMLPAHVKEWFDRPKSQWKELTLGTAKNTLVDDDRILKVLATPGLTFENLISVNRFEVFVRRIKEDFGLPAPDKNNPEEWRKKAVAALLCTDAASKNPDNPPGDKEWIISTIPTRNNALKLLSRWLKQVDLLEYFEELAVEADKLTTLQYWARNLDQIPAPLSSPISENALFQTEIERLTKIDAFDDVAKYLDAHVTVYQAHANGYWGKLAKSKVQWNYLVDMASIASLLYQQAKVESGWKSPMDAVKWFISSGWQVDHAGETLFLEDANIPGGLIAIRLKLRKAYLRHLVRINVTFSELIAHNTLETLSLPFAGEAIKDIVKVPLQEPIALIILDACRYDLGCRLGELLNSGEPNNRAEVIPAVAPIPSVTALGMPLCLPGIADKLNIELPEKEGAFWRVTADGFLGDLAQAGMRREWLKAIFNLKEKSLLSVTDVLDSDKVGMINVKSHGKLVVVFGDEFDVEGHEGQLKIEGAKDLLERYAQVIRKLRSGGYSTIAVVTDHGFFHWEPEQDEVEPKPKGDIRLSSRRAIVGSNLKHPSAIPLKVTGSNLECLVPRSVNAFKTYGGLGFFHGGATLQEMIIPVIIAKWPKKALKIKVVLKPISQITSQTQRVEVAPGAVQKDIIGGFDRNLLGRKVLVKVIQPETGKLIFKSNSIDIEPGGKTKHADLVKIEGTVASINSILEIRIEDADDEEILDKANAILKIELDEWS